jgi:hypothetical protein
MSRSIASRILNTGGRYLTVLEEEQILAWGLESPSRVAVSRLLEEHEDAIVAKATNRFCDGQVDFNAPAGSRRRVKGMQDGRLLLRHVAQSVREGSIEPLDQKVLSWFVGLLEEQEVTGRHVEIFLFLLGEAAREELPSRWHPLLDDVFDKAVSYTRQAAAGASVAARKGRIAEFAIDRLCKVMPAVEKKFASATRPKGRVDCEHLLLEMPKWLHNVDEAAAVEQATRWVVERLIGFVDFEPEVWNWHFLSLQEGIVQRCGAEVGLRTAPILEQLAQNSKRLVAAAAVFKHSVALGQAAAEALAPGLPSQGVDPSPATRSALAEAGRVFLTNLAVVTAGNGVDKSPARLAEIWCEEFLPALPRRDAAFYIPAVKALGGAVQRKLGGAGAELLGTAFRAAGEVAKRAEAAARLTTVAGTVVDRTAAHCYTRIDAFREVDATYRMAGHRDLRLILSRIIQLLPSGPATVNRAPFRRWLADHVLAHLGNLPADAVVEAYQLLGTALADEAAPEDFELVQGFLDEAVQCVEANALLTPALDRSAAAVGKAVARCYPPKQDVPVDEQVDDGDVAVRQAAERDGIHLVRATVKAARVGGEEATEDLLRWYREQIVRFSKLPGGTLAAFVTAVGEYFSDVPELAVLFERLAQSAPGMAAGLKIFDNSEALAQEATQKVLEKMPLYRDQIGAGGAQAALRDNTITLRGLGLHLVRANGDAGSFRDWWKVRIGKNIVTRPPQLLQRNREELGRVLERGLDDQEGDAALTLLSAAYDL